MFGWICATDVRLAQLELIDQVRALAYAGQMFPNRLDMDRVFIHGWSFGGYLSLMALATMPHMYKVRCCYCARVKVSCDDRVLVVGRLRQRLGRSLAGSCTIRDIPRGIWAILSPTRRAILRARWCHWWIAFLASELDGLHVDDWCHSQSVEGPGDCCSSTGSWMRTCLWSTRLCLSKSCLSEDGRIRWR
jgi:hypothetical protein